MKFALGTRAPDARAAPPIALAAAQSLGYAYAFANNSSLLGATSLGNVLVDHSLRSYVLVVMTLTAGATLAIGIVTLLEAAALSARSSPLLRAPG